MTSILALGVVLAATPPLWLPPAIGAACYAWLWGRVNRRKV